jgi:hypothetical protein
LAPNPNPAAFKWWSGLVPFSFQFYSCLADVFAQCASGFFYFAQSSDVVAGDGEDKDPSVEGVV